jgi:hypothetical protein
MRTLNVTEFVEKVAEVNGGDYPGAFKLLGFAFFIVESGSEGLLANGRVSQKTMVRWIENIEKAGWGDIVSDARMRLVVQDYLWRRFAGLPIRLAREKVRDIVAEIISKTEEQPPQAVSRQESDAVKGERSECEARKAQPSALDGRATGGSLGGAAAPYKAGEKHG